MRRFPKSAFILLMLLGTRSLAADLPNGNVIYDANCAGCHSKGMAGSPRLGDAAAWGARFDKGINVVYKNAIKGLRTMPPRGGNASLSDAEVMAAVNYIAGASLSSAGGARTPPASGGASTGGGKVAISEGANSDKGKRVYQASCAACHTPGLAGAPKLDDGSAWAARSAQGPAALYANAIKGKGNMPARGGNALLPDADVRAAVDFMLAQTRSGSALKPAPRLASSRTTTNPAFASPKASVVVANAAREPASALAPGLATRESSDPNAFNRLLVAPSRRNPPPAQDGIHDPANPGTKLLQAPRTSFRSLASANLGNNVNWVAALDKHQIQPRWDATGDPKAKGTVMDLTIIREVKGSMPDVVFPHKQHTEWLECANCHPGIFVPQKGANQISMAAIMLGQKCGVCHGKVAFPISECRLCHARKKGSGPRAAQMSPGAGTQ